MKELPDLVYIDNFFQDLPMFESILRTKYKYYTIDEHKKLNLVDPTSRTKWPGVRTNWLADEDPIFVSLIVAEMRAKFDWIFSSNTGFTTMYAALHQRFDKDESEDFIHIDNEYYTLLVYLSDTNIDSGTKFYDEQDNCVATINFVKNRAVLFKGSIRHKGFGHHGTDLSNGRLTLNCFIQ